MTIEMQTETYSQDLGGGLRLRRSTAADADALAEFNSMVHSDEGPSQPDPRVAAWTRDLLERPHPTCTPADFTLVEDTNTGKIVSSMDLISQTWTYGGIPFGVGRPELVGTLPEYRNRGLVRAQFDVVHRWSAERGELVQAITGIPYYYRLFGYDMCLNLGGGRAGYLTHVRSLQEGEQEAFTFRAPVPDDLPFILRMDEQFRSRSLLACLRNEEQMLYELFGKNELNVNRLEVEIIQNRENEPVGVVGHPPFTWGTMMVAQFYELVPGLSWGAVTPAVVRHLIEMGNKRMKNPIFVYGTGLEGKSIESFGFWLGSQHPVYEVMVNRLPRIRPPYAFYLRVPELPAFLRKITPVLEDRLSRSPIQGHSGEIKITFYSSGLRLAFEQGRLTHVEPWQPSPVGHSGGAAFPELTFYQVLFGYRSFNELRDARADVWFEDDLDYALINALFPKQHTDLWPLS